MHQSILKYAKNNIDEQENGIKVLNYNGSLYIETVTGRNFELSENEIKSQAIDYLNREIDNIRNNF